MFMAYIPPQVNVYQIMEVFSETAYIFAAPEIR